MYSRNLKKIGRSKGFGFCKILARSAPWGAPHTFSDSEKTPLTLPGLDLAVCGPDFFQNHRANAKKIKIQKSNFRKNHDRLLEIFDFLSRFSLFQENRYLPCETVFRRGDHYRRQTSKSASLHAPLGAEPRLFDWQIQPQTPSAPRELLERRGRAVFSCQKRCNVLVNQWLTPATSTLHL